MDYPNKLDSKNFCILATQVKTKVEESYVDLGLLGFNWRFVSRVTAYIQQKKVTTDHNFSYFLVRDPSVFDYLIKFFKAKGHKPLIEKLQANNGEAEMTKEFFDILQDCLSNVHLYNKIEDCRRNNLDTVNLRAPYNAIYPIYAEGVELSADSTAAIEEAIAEEEVQDLRLTFEVLYHSAKTKEVESFDLVFDEDNNRVEANGFHKPLKKKYTLEGFFIPKKSNKLVLDLTRENSKETLHLDINLGNFDLKEANYFSGTYIGTSFRTNKTISGTIYLLRRPLLTNGYDETREQCRLELERQLNLQPPSIEVAALNPLGVQKNKQEKKTREEVLADYIDVYLACTRKKGKEEEGDLMQVSILTLKDNFVASYQLPGTNKRDSYRCYIEFIDGGMEEQQALSLKLSFSPPNQPFMQATVGLPSEKGEQDKNKLEGYFSSLKDGGGIVLYRLQKNTPAKPEIVSMDKNKVDIYREIWGMLAALNSPFL